MPRSACAPTPGWYFAHAQDDLNLHICACSKAFSLDVVHKFLCLRHNSIFNRYTFFEAAVNIQVNSRGPSKPDAVLNV